MPRRSRARALVLAAAVLLGAAVPAAEAATVIESRTVRADRLDPCRLAACSSPLDEAERPREERAGDAGRGRGAGGRDRRERRAAREKVAPASPDAGPAPAGAASREGGAGTLSPWTTLGFKDPMCASPGRLNESQRRNCRYSQTISSRHPSANYAFDINVDSGPTNPIASVKEMLQELFNAVWVFGLDCLKFVLAVLQWAFGLELFTGRAMGSIDSTLGRMYAALDRPFFHALLGVLGLWAIWVGLLQQRRGQMYGGVALSLAMLVLAMWVIHEPRQSVGRLAGLSNDVALVLIAAPLAATAQDKGRALTRPHETFGTALGDVFDRLVAKPWAALNFGDVGWSQGRPEAVAVRAAAEQATADSSYTFPVQRDHPELGQIKDPEARKKRLEQLVRERAGSPPRTRAELYLRHSPNSAPRDALWKVYFGDKPDPSEVKWLAKLIGTDSKVGLAPDKVAIQGEGGTFVRPALLLILLVGGLGALLLLAWLAVRLVFQAVLGFALLLCAPLALFLVVCGESGRQSFLLWARALLGAILSKAIYAALLAVTLLGVSVVGGLGEGTGAWPAAFLLQSAFFWALFLSRDQLLGFISVGAHSEGSGRSSNAVRSLLLAKQASRELLPGGRAPARPAGTPRPGETAAPGMAPGSRAETRALRNQESAERALSPPREALAEADHRRAQEAVAEHQALRNQLRALETTPELRELDEARQRGAAHGLAPVAASEDQQRLENRRNALRAREQRLAPRAQAATATLAEQDRSLREYGQRVAPGQEAPYHERLRREFAADPRSIDHASLAHLATEREGRGLARPMTRERYEAISRQAGAGRPEAIAAKGRADRQIERGVRRELAEAAPPPPGSAPKPIREVVGDARARAQRPLHEHLARANPMGEHRRGGREAHAAGERRRSRARMRSRL